jgi:hypothetical protein
MLTISLWCQWMVVTSNTSQRKNIKKRSKEGKRKLPCRNKRTLRHNPSLMNKSVVCSPSLESGRWQNFELNLWRSQLIININDILPIYIYIVLPIFCP